MQRRTFLTGAGAALTGAGTSLAAAASPWTSRLGIMCQLASSEAPARKVLAAARQAGFRSVQVNFPWNQVDAVYLRGLPSWLKAAQLRCDVLSAYVNCLQPTSILMSTREQDFARAINYAAEIGAGRVVAWTGSHVPDLMKSDPRNFSPAAVDPILRFLEPFVERLDKLRVKLALETYITLACPDAASLRKLLDRLPTCVGAVMDPPNLTPPTRYPQRDEALVEMFATLHGRIAVVHMKDFRLKDTGDYDLPGPLDGAMNYKLFVAQLASVPAEVPIIAEHLAPAQYAEARRRLLQL